MRNQQTENITGIYKITNKNNGKIYIGQSQNILLRWEQHKQGYQTLSGWYEDARNESESIDDFSFEVIQECKKEELDELEIYWINYYDSIKQGYNRAMPTFSLGRKNAKLLYSKNKVPYARIELRYVIQQAGARLNKVAFNLFLYCLFQLNSAENQITFSIADFKEKWNITGKDSGSLAKKELISYGYLKEDEYGQIIFDANGDLKD